MIHFDTFCISQSDFMGKDFKHFPVLNAQITHGDTGGCKTTPFAVQLKPHAQFVLSMYPLVFPRERAPDDHYNSRFAPRLDPAAYRHNQTQKKRKGLQRFRIVRHLQKLLNISAVFTHINLLCLFFIAKARLAVAHAIYRECFKTCAFLKGKQ